MFNFKKGKIMTHLTESPMTGRLKKGHSELVSTKLIFSTNKFQTVSYPTILNGLPNGNMKLELQRKGSMGDGGRSRLKDSNDWNENETATIYKYFPNAHIDDFGNVYASKKAMRIGISPLEAIRTFAKFQQLTEMLERKSDIYTMANADRDGLLGNNEYDDLFFSENNSFL